jgi:DNA-directed RNA polymerase specialized sigma24 family protein
VTEPSPPKTRAPDLDAAREAVSRLMQAHGAEVYRYCVAMLGPEGAAAMLPTIFGHLQEHAAAHDHPVERLMALAVAHNRCIERSRTGGRPQSGQGQEGEVGRVLRAFAQLKPVGRDALLLRSVLGLRWSELERVCGVSTVRMIERVCRGWRNTAEVAAGRSAGPGLRPPPGRRLGEADEAWAPIREDAQRFVALRRALREVTLAPAPAEGWEDDVWQRLEQEREDQRHVALERAAERAAAEAARAAKEAARSSEAAAAERAAAERAAGAFTSSVDEDEAEDPAPRARSLRWLGVGVALALVGLAARWLMMQ